MVIWSSVTYLPEVLKCTTTVTLMSKSFSEEEGAIGPEKAKRRDVHILLRNTRMRVTTLELAIYKTS